MNSIQDIYEAIATNGFGERTLQLIDEQVNDIPGQVEAPDGFDYYLIKLDGVSAKA